jgi:ABC-2 type transport system permease protein
MVAPVKRQTIVLGKTVGGVTTALIQALLILILAIPLGMKITGILPSQFSVAGLVLGFLLAIVFMILIGLTFAGLGVAFASKMKDFHGFQLVWNFIVFPVFLLSGALLPLDVFPNWLRYLSYLNPLTYGVDGLRGSLVGVSDFPLFLDLGLMLASSAITVLLAAYLFRNTEVD